MKKNLGQLLVEKKLISDKDLASALQRQIIFGGRLGTNLLELGLISEEKLMQVLADQYGTPFAKAEHFRDIPGFVLESVPRDLVARHGVVPVAFEGNRITLAMRDPDKLDIIDEVSFRSGKAIRPIVASELRVVQALEDYFGIKREARYIYVPPSRGTAPERKEQQPESPGKDGRPGDEDVIDLTDEDLLEKDLLDPTPVNKAFLNITNRDEVAATVIRAGLYFMDDVFLFVVKENKATGWMSGGSTKPIVDFGSISYPVAPQNVLGKVGESRSLERFPGVEIFESDPWLKELSLLVPKEVIICPMLLKNHVVSILVGFNFRRPIEELDAQYLVRIMRKASVALEILILKSRIIML
ncbi:MAG: hypothetical protein JXR72_06305 [Proteobacteria bacterium]|nr:hypothetical protein [Pseudomonadota bacterium]